MQAKEPNEVLGNKDAKHTLKFEYCGGWGYRRHVVAAIDEIEKAAAGVFKYTLYMDKATSGRLEVTLFKDSQSDSGEGELVHSKVASGKYIKDDYSTFVTLIQNVLEWDQTLNQEEEPKFKLGLGAASYVQANMQTLREHLA